MKQTSGKRLLLSKAMLIMFFASQVSMIITEKSESHSNDAPMRNLLGKNYSDKGTTEGGAGLLVQSKLVPENDTRGHVVKIGDVNGYTQNLSNRMSNHDFGKENVTDTEDEDGFEKNGLSSDALTGKIRKEDSLLNTSLTNERRFQLYSEDSIVESNGDDAFTSNTHITLQPTDEEIEETDRKLTFTCAGLCGQNLIMPCSCHPACLIYDTCCENITHDCPLTVKKGLQLFSSFFQAKLVCTDDDVYKISSCPSDENSRQETSTDGGQMKRINGTQEFKPNKNDLELAVINSPVTDARYGLTFSNMSTFDCYRNQINLGEPLRWGIMLQPTSSSPISIYDVGVGDSIQSSVPIFKNTFIIFPSFCQTSFINTCNRSLSSFLESDEKRCKEFAGYLTSFVTHRGYRNRYCAYCNEGRHKEYFPVSIRYDFMKVSDLKTVVSLTKSGRFSVELLEPYAASQVSWSTGVCSTLGTQDLVDKPLAGSDNERVEYDRLRCSLECSTELGFTLHSDGRCKTKNFVYIALGVDDVSKIAIACPSGLAKFANFVSCSMGVLFVDEEWQYNEFLQPTASIALDLRTNRTLYGAELSWFTPNVIQGSLLAYSKFRSLPNLSKFTNIINAFKLYLHDHPLCPSHDGGGISLKYDKELQSVEFSDVLKLHEVVNVSDGISPLRGKGLRTDNLSVICISEFVSERSKRQNRFIPKCMEDILYENDEVQIERVLASSCVRHFDDPYVPLRDSVELPSQDDRIYLLCVSGLVIIFRLLD